MEDFNMNKLNEWCDRLIEHEGIRLMPYYCPMGKLTIGVGRNLDDNPLNNEEKKALGDYMRGITENGAKMLLRNDIKRCYGALKKMILNFRELDNNRQYAMIDMCFQLGVGGFRQFKRMRRYMGKRNFIMASYECLQSSYAMQTPNRAKRIARVISTGVWK
jgi:lysozyme